MVISRVWNFEARAQKLAKFVDLRDSISYVRRSSFQHMSLSVRSFLMFLPRWLSVYLVLVEAAHVTVSSFY